MAEGVLPARANGIPIVSIGTILPVNDSALMSLADEGITSPADLAGKTYGGYSGPLETELINRLAECGGIDPASVKHIDVGNVDYLAGLEANRFDVVWIFAGWDALRASDVEHKDVNLIRFDDEFDCIPNWYTPLFITNEKLIEQDPAFVQNVPGRHRARLPARDRRPATSGRPDARGGSRDGRAADPRVGRLLRDHVSRRTVSRSARRTRRRGRRSSSSSSTPDCWRSRWTCDEAYTNDFLPK